MYNIMLSLTRYIMTVKLHTYTKLQQSAKYLKIVHNAIVFELNEAMLRVN